MITWGGALRRAIGEAEHASTSTDPQWHKAHTQRAKVWVAIATEIRAAEQAHQAKSVGNR